MAIFSRFSKFSSSSRPEPTRASRLARSNPRESFRKKSCLNYKTNFPLAQLDYSRRTDYDECAHGWLDGLNRLFMEAKPAVAAFFSVG